MNRKEKKALAEKKEKILKIIKDVLLNDETELIKKFDHAFRKIAANFKGHILWIYMEDKAIGFHELKVNLTRREFNKVKDWIKLHEENKKTLDDIQRLDDLENLLNKAKNETDDEI